MADLLMHAGQWIFFGVLLFAPVPWCLLGIEVSGPRRWFLLLDMWCLIQTSVTLVLGIWHCLTFTGLLVAETALLLFGVLFFFFFDGHKESRRGSYVFLPTEMFLLAFLFSAGALLGWRLMAQPITEYDSLAYHLPAMARWHQTGSLAGTLDQFKTNPIGGYPYNWEALCTLPVMPFGEDFLVAFPNLIAWALLGLSVYLAGVVLGTKRTHAAMAAALLLAMPLMREHVLSLRADLPLAAFFAAGLYLVFSYRCTASSTDLALFLANLGMLAGVRTSGLVYGFLLVVLLLVMSVTRGTVLPPKQSRKFPRLLWCLAVLGCLFLGGFWYGKNYSEKGNPLSGVQVGLAQHMLFTQGKDFSSIYKTTLAYLFNVRDLAHWKILLGQIKYWLHFPFLILAGLAALFFMARKRSHRLLLAFLLVMTALLYWFTPVSGDNGANGWQITPWVGQGLRYAFPFLVVLAVTAALSATALGIKDTAILILVGLSVVSFRNENLWVMGILFFAAILIFRPQSRTPFLVATATLILCAAFIARERRDEQRAKAYGGILEYIATHVRPDETIGYLLSHQSYLFYGKELNRKVCYVPAVSEDLAAWLDMLHRSGVSVIAAGPLREEWKSRRELAWLDDPHGPFVRVFGGDNTGFPLLYRFERNRRE